MLPRWETPEHTQGYEGFYHLVGMEGTVEQSTLSYIIRDHDRDRFERRKKEFAHLVNKINAEFGDGTATLELRDQYYNMREKVIEHPHVLDIAQKAMRDCDIEPVLKPIRGGTDGAQLSFRGLPCPNLSTGGYCYHGVNEFVPVSSLVKMTDVLQELVARFA